MARLRLVADRSYHPVRGPIDTLIVTGVDRSDDARRDLDLVRAVVVMVVGKPPSVRV
jgi:hypothetical protein